MTENRLTTQQTWRKHWLRKDNIQLIPDNYCYHDIIRRAVKKIPLNGTCIELGGFPGKFSIFFKKYCRLNPTVLDFYFDETTLRDQISFNGLQYKDIKFIQADFLTHVPVEHYDMVCSFGLIEHFKDLKEVINMHVKYMKPGAVLLICLPNFRGVNGLLQKYFDPANLAIHNLEIMDTVLLKKALTQIGLIEIDVSYYPSTQIWLEDLRTRGIVINILVRVLDRLMRYAGQIFGMQNKLLSNSIMILARSPQA